MAIPAVVDYSLIFFAILNVSTAFIDVADMNHFYSYAFITPVWNAVDAAKSIAFGTKNHLVRPCLRSGLPKGLELTIMRSLFADNDRRRTLE